MSETKGFTGNKKLDKDLCVCGDPRGKHDPEDGNCEAGKYPPCECKMFREAESVSGEPPRAEPPCEFCAKQDKEFEYLRASDTGAWQYRNKHGHWVNCPTLKAGSRPSAPAPSAEPQIQEAPVPDVSKLPRFESAMDFASYLVGRVQAFNEKYPKCGFPLYNLAMTVDKYVEQRFRDAAESSPVDLQQEAREWLEGAVINEGLVNCGEPEFREAIVTILAAFAAQRSPEVPKPVDLQQAWTPEQCEQWMIDNDLTSYDPATGYFSNGMSFAEVLAAFAAYLRGK